MRYIKIPQEPVQLINRLTNEPLSNYEPITFRDFVVGTLLFDPKWVTDIQSMRQANKLVESLKESNGVLELDEGLWETLCQVAVAPRYILSLNGKNQLIRGYHGLHPLIAPQLVPFIDAILNAESIEE